MNTFRLVFLSFSIIVSTGLAEGGACDPVTGGCPPVIVPTAHFDPFVTTINSQVPSTMPQIVGFDPFAVAIGSQISPQSIWTPPINPRATAHDVTTMYRQVLNREPEPAGLLDWTTRGLSRDRVLEGITHSQEARNTINSFYVTYLGREGTIREITDWTDRLFQECRQATPGSNCMQNIQMKILGSAEAQRRSVNAGQGMSISGGLDQCQYFRQACDAVCGGLSFCTENCLRNIEPGLNCSSIGNVGNFFY